MTEQNINDIKYMTAAMNEAKLAFKDGEIPVGAVIVKDGKIIAAGHNMREQKHSVVSHAEIEAINDACAVLKSWRLTGCTMYVTMEPCSMCAGAILNARLDRVVYGVEDLNHGALGSKINIFAAFGKGVPRIKKGVLKDESLAIIKEFFAKVR